MALSPVSANCNERPSLISCVQLFFKLPKNIVVQGMLRWENIDRR